MLLIVNVENDWKLVYVFSNMEVIGDVDNVVFVEGWEWIFS